MRVCTVLLFTVLAGSAAWADAKQAQSCAASLAADSKLIFDASVADVSAGADIKSTLESKTRSLVIDGKVARSNARPSAEAAGACLKMLKS